MSRRHARFADTDLTRHQGGRPAVAFLRRKIMSSATDTATVLVSPMATNPLMSQGTVVQLRPRLSRGQLRAACAIKRVPVKSRIVTFNGFSFDIEPMTEEGRAAIQEAVRIISP